MNSSNLIVRIASIRLEKMSPFKAAMFVLTADYVVLRILNQRAGTLNIMNEWVSGTWGDFLALPVLVFSAVKALQEGRSRRFSLLSSRSFVAKVFVVAFVLRCLGNIQDVVTGLRSIQKTFTLRIIYHIIITPFMYAWILPLFLKSMLEARLSKWQIPTALGGVAYLLLLRQDYKTIKQKTRDR